MYYYYFLLANARLKYITGCYGCSVDDWGSTAVLCLTDEFFFSSHWISTTTLLYGHYRLSPCFCHISCTVCSIPYAGYGELKEDSHCLASPCVSITAGLSLLQISWPCFYLAYPSYLPIVIRQSNCPLFFLKVVSLCIFPIVAFLSLQACCFGLGFTRYISFFRKCSFMPHVAVAGLVWSWDGLTSWDTSDWCLSLQDIFSIGHIRGEKEEAIAET